MRTLALIVSCGIASALAAFAAPPRQKSIGTALAADSHLSRTANIECDRRSLAEVCDTLAEAAAPGILRTEADVADRQIILHGPPRSIRKWMNALAEATGLEWRPEGGNYLLRRSAERREAEEKEIRESELRARQAEKAKADGLLEAIEKTLRGSKPGKNAFADLVSTLSPGQRAALAGRAADPQGVISASSNSHLRSRLMFVTPYEHLSPPARGAVDRMVGAGGYERPDGNFARAAKPGQSLAGFGVGLVVEGGSVRLAVVRPNGEIWMSPFDEIRRRGIPGVDSDDDLPPEVGEAVARSRRVDLRGLPEDLAKVRFSFPKEIIRTSLGALLSHISKQLNLPIACDGFLRSTRTTYHWLLTDQDNYTLSEALHQIAGAYGHEFHYRDGFLIGKTLTLGIDLRSEPPAKYLERLRDLTKRKADLDFGDYLEMAQLPPLQLETLRSSRFSDIRRNFPLFRAEQAAPVLRFFASLSTSERKRAESPEGLPYADMDVKTKRAFDALADSGVPGPGGIDESPKYAGLRAIREHDKQHETWRFKIVSHSRPPRVTEHRLDVR